MQSVGALNKPQRVVVFLIDGLHWKAPLQLNMPVLNSLITQGTYINKSYMIAPHHPTVGEYGNIHTSSFPNPVLQEGTLFIKPGNRMLQDMFSPIGTSAFVTNTKAYLSVSKGFSINIHNPEMTDDAVVEQSLDLLMRYDIKYSRIHLQSPGNEGRYLTYTTPDKPYYRNIWGDGSPYVKSIENADALLGSFVSTLQKRGLLESTLLVVSSDQGQSERGWHPIIDPDSGITPLLFMGPSVARNRILPYFEHTDLSPTIAALMDVLAPNSDGGAGRFIKEILEDADPAGFSHAQYIKAINEQLNRYNALRARIMIAAEQDTYFSSLISYLENELLTPEPFYHQDRFFEWHKAGTTSHLIEVNEHILQVMADEYKDSNNG
jgi:predicted AlkP superfamily pyrophosphatase or phosphodiesterase